MIPYPRTKYGSLAPMLPSIAPGKASSTSSQEGRLPERKPNVLRISSGRMWMRARHGGLKETWPRIRFRNASTAFGKVPQCKPQPRPAARRGVTEKWPMSASVVPHRSLVSVLLVVYTSPVHNGDSYGDSTTESDVGFGWILPLESERGPRIVGALDVR